MTSGHKKFVLKDALTTPNITVAVGNASVTRALQSIPAGQWFRVTMVQVLCDVTGTITVAIMAIGPGGSGTGAMLGPVAVSTAAIDELMGWVIEGGTGVAVGGQGFVSGAILKGSVRGLSSQPISFPYPVDLSVALIGTNAADSVIAFAVVELYDLVEDKHV